MSEHWAIRCIICKWLFHCPREQTGRVMCRACESFSDVRIG